MVICCAVGCSKQYGRGKVNVYSIPAVMTHHGQQGHALVQRRHREFLAAIGRADLSGSKMLNATICSRHFVSGASANLLDDTDVNWVPTRKLGVDRQERDVKQVSEHN